MAGRVGLQKCGFHGNVDRERPVLYMIQSRPDESGERLEDAFGRLLESLRPDLVRFAYWLARDRAIAEDVVQEAMLRAWRARLELKDAAAARHWMLTIVRREHARLYERKRLVTVDLSDVVAREDAALARAGDGELLDLRGAILRLPDEYREPLVMQVLGGYSTAEIAKEMNLSTPAVLTRLFRARNRLREIYGLTPDVDCEPEGQMP
jgi:RNA polymerase sigma-70 factor (ECF subfamily)